jgi:hypothetical protein
MKSVWILKGAGMAALLAMGAAGCGHSQAHVVTPVALAVPPPPARVAVPVQIADEEPPPPQPMVESLPAPPVRPRENPARPADRTSPAAAPPAASAPAETAAPPTATLQSATDPGIVERTRALLAKAQQDLDVVRPHVRDLNKQARAQFETAEGFIRNATHALEIRNYMMASSLAEKAAALASALARG